MPKKTKPRTGNINNMRVLRVKNPKKKSAGANMKDGKKFKPKGTREKPKSKKANILIHKNVSLSTILKF